METNWLLIVVPSVVRIFQTFPSHYILLLAFGSRAGSRGSHYQSHLGPDSLVLPLSYGVPVIGLRDLGRGRVQV